jgi:2-desacetyl-2-hydroxyethyl bacteriochlorophyllide A dehydrogenase
VTQSRGLMEVVELPEPGEPAPAEVIVRPEVVGICGSDLHIFLGEMGPPEAADAFFPRIQGHEACGIIEALGPGCPDRLRVGERVAIWPVQACGSCYTCRIGRGNACPNFELVGVHVDGALQEQLRLPATQVFPVGDQNAEVAALVEPISIGVRTAVRARIEPGERVVVLGAGPIGQAACLSAKERGASVLVVDPIDSRLEHAGRMGADLVTSSIGTAAVELAREWTNGEGPEVVIEAVGAPAAVESAVEMVASAGRVVVAGLSDKTVQLPITSLPMKEIDLLGASCCNASEFAEAVDLVGRRREIVGELVTHELPLERAPDAIAHAIAQPHDVMKFIVRVSA